MAFDSRHFRDVMGRFATGVTVITLAGDGSLYGITVNSFTSVSLDPMLVLVCIDKTATTYDAFQVGRGFTVNILTEGQEALSGRFASKEIQDKFDGIEYTMGGNGAPILGGVLACLECRITLTYEGGDHTIFMGEVQSARIFNEQKPLLFYAGKYRAIKS